MEMDAATISTVNSTMSKMGFVTLATQVQFFPEKAAPNLRAPIF